MTVIDIISQSKKSQVIKIKLNFHLDYAKMRGTQFCCISSNGSSKETDEEVMSIASQR